MFIGFCRRFATYKRAHLLFTDLGASCLRSLTTQSVLLSSSSAGKAHPADGAGQGLIKKIYEISQRPEFLGKIIFLEDYDFMLARRLVSGVDIWMNTPTRPLEASGTSGEKAEMNGVVNLSVLDGWWLEGYRKGAGWALTEKRTYQNQGYQDQLDAATIYDLLGERTSSLCFTTRMRKGYSEGWIQVSQELYCYYRSSLYNEASARTTTMISSIARRLLVSTKLVLQTTTSWLRILHSGRRAVAERWDAINVESASWNIPATGAQTGETYTIRYVINEQGLSDAVGLELVSIRTDKDGEERVFNIRPLEVVGHEGNNYIFEGKVTPDVAGNLKSAVRMYPKNANLPHRQDFCYVKWFALPNA